MNTTDEAMRSVIQGPADVEWRYEMRRECQEILPNLYLGPFVASKSLDVLQSLKITHIVCIRDAKEAFSVRPRFPERFHYMTLDVEDNEEQNLIRLFPGQVPASHRLTFTVLTIWPLIRASSACSYSPSRLHVTVQNHSLTVPFPKHQDRPDASLSLPLTQNLAELA
ncbi:hypothetical protein D9619_007049 [Psilocybe cf. subviscida]|uniref:Uncharacterized protein n=1 Tax=Psilocybe cf. subviscida TaxID=2480587 RepID=A0A8H5EXD2_9AGAR|nr:hypothetical protein D9619_007049 [Psilocybe cf. subviscida]